VSTGIDGTEQWNYVDARDWSNGTLVVENVEDTDRLAIQYDADKASNETVWLKVPDGESRDAPVYSFVRSSGDDGNATVVLVTEEDEPPAIRIKRQRTARDGVGSVLNDWKVAWERARGFVGGLFGSDS